MLTDQQMPRRTGVQLLEWVREHSPRTVRLLMTGYAELEDAVEAINRGHVYHYLLKPWRTEDCCQILRNAAEKFTLERKPRRAAGRAAAAQPRAGAAGGAADARAGGGQPAAAAADAASWSGWR